ncbi:class I SAM-dependent methyltransferase [Fulvimonas yonginensis]|uniref:Class I SAM-dependent methyltransferase n=1 Tax=Fulvimonas yonginensis TaxID=1495200 RepID=A0ABU8JA42_9GAMM
MQDRWRMVRCGWCRSLYLDPRPDAASLPAAYATYYTHQSADENERRTGVVPGLINGYLNWRFRMSRQPASRLGIWAFKLLPPLRKKLDVYGRHIPRLMCGRGTRLLDVGCGSGAFLLRAQEMGIQASGCEPDPRAVEACRSQGLDVIQGDVFAPELDSEKFDIVTLNHVIEHVYDPLALLGRIHGRMTPGGILWVALPNPGALGLILFAQGWKGLHPPFHLLIPSQRLLISWLRETGFVDVRLVRRGCQSPGLWRESAQIAEREKLVRPRTLRVLVRILGDILSTVSTRWCEETILTARKSKG